MGGACLAHGTAKKCTKVLVGKFEGTTLLERPSRRWKDDSHTDVK